MHDVHCTSFIEFATSMNRRLADAPCTYSFRQHVEIGHSSWTQSWLCVQQMSSPKLCALRRFPSDTAFMKLAENNGDARLPKMWFSHHERAKFEPKFQRFIKDVKWRPSTSHLPNPTSKHLLSFRKPTLLWRNAAQMPSEQFNDESQICGCFGILFGNFLGLFFT